MADQTHKHIIKELHKFCELYNIESLFVAGDYCRNFFLNPEKDPDTLEIISAFPDQSMELGSLFATEFLHEQPTVNTRTQTISIKPMGVTIEFQGKSKQSYMQHEEVLIWMRSQQLDDVPLMNNLYGRDFTLNTIVYSIQHDKFLDPTKQASVDLESKNIKSILPAELLIKYSPVSIFQAIKLSMIHDLHIDAELRTEMKNKGNILLNALSIDRILKEIVGILTIDGPEGLKVLQDYSLDKFLLHQDIKKYVNTGN